MGYFSNGAEGDMYEAKYCERCIHVQDYEKGCPIFGLHYLYNGEKDKTTLLDMLIPRSEEGFNLQCRMFIEVKP